MKGMEVMLHDGCMDGISSAGLRGEVFRLRY